MERGHMIMTVQKRWFYPQELVVGAAQYDSLVLYDIERP